MPCKPRGAATVACPRRSDNGPVARMERSEIRVGRCRWRHFPAFRFAPCGRLAKLRTHEGNAMLARRRFLTGAAALAAPLYVRSGRAETYPSRFVRLVVPFPPGGTVDAGARILAARLSEMWGQQMVIENRAGIGGNIGAAAGLAPAPGGHTGSLP